MRNITNAFSLAGLLAVGLSVFQACQDNPYQQGEILYQNFCANCHMEDGQGLQGVIPPLAGADYLGESGARTACVIRYGLEGEIEVNDRTYSQAMAGIDVLTDFEIANVINYIHHAWGNDYGYIKVQDIRSALDSCKQARPLPSPTSDF